ncbi:MAG: hypothetical protein QME78_00320 [Thermodesulfobacteriota bacterium]|nr:hypothetical protein [Thermodesulfobacteriota bacterium]
MAKNPNPFNHPGAQPPKAKTQFPKSAHAVEGRNLRHSRPKVKKEEPWNPYIDAPCPNHANQLQYGKSGVCKECLFKQIGIIPKEYKHED